MTVIDDIQPSYPDLATSWVDLARAIGEELRPAVAASDRDGELSRPAFDTLRERGVLAALVPAECGGGGAGHEEFGALLRELGRHDGPTAVTLSMHSHLVATQVWRHRHGMDAGGFFAKVVDGAMCISTGASDWLGSSGSAAPVDGGFVVSARKGPASGCEVGDLLVTTVRWDDAPEGPQVIHCAVPFGADGVTIEQTWDTMGMRATGSHTVVLDEVFVPASAVAMTRPADVWHPVWSAVLGSAMPLIMSAYVGIADAAVDVVHASVAGRTDPHVLQLVGEMTNAHVTAIDLVDAMLRSSDDLNFDNTASHASLTLARKTVAADALIDTVRLGIEATGGFGYTRRSDLERLYRDIHGCLFHPLPRAKQTAFTGRVALGHPPAGPFN